MKYRINKWIVFILALLLICTVFVGGGKEGSASIRIGSLKEGYNGDLTSKEAGSIGGEMVRRMIKKQEEQMK